MYRLRLGQPRPYELGLGVLGHGWVDLDPNQWKPDERCFSTVLRLGPSVFDALVRERGDQLELELQSTAKLSALARARAKVQLTTMLRLNEDLEPFHELCREHSVLSWAARRGAGRLLRAPCWFEDLAKILLTTNCSWSQTRNMVGRLCQGLGQRTPSGKHAFPAPRAVLTLGPARLRSEMRVGYRAEALAELAEYFRRPRAETRFENLAGNAEKLRAELLTLRGFGPYAIGQALRLAGYYDDYALDSWCRSKLLARRQGDSAGALERRYGRFRSYRGLALWLDLTAPWHGEGPFAGEGRSPLTSG